MKECFKCKEVLNREDFYKHPQTADGLLGKCKECAKRDNAANREANLGRYRDYDRRRYQHNPERRAYAMRLSKRHYESNPLKSAARAAVNNAVRDGRMSRGQCILAHKGGCDGRIHGHHMNYRRPLDVHWLCSAHHHAVHAGRETTITS